MKRILFYTNQFFGQIGGEEFAYTEPFVEDGPRGNANAFAPSRAVKSLLRSSAEITISQRIWTYARNL